MKQTQQTPSKQRSWVRTREAHVWHPSSTCRLEHTPVPDEVELDHDGQSKAWKMPGLGLQKEGGEQKRQADACDEGQAKPSPAQPVRLLQRRTMSRSSPPTPSGRCPQPR